MARNGAGAYSLPAGNPVVTGTVISSSTMNTTLSDIATALTASIANDGQTTPVANIPMGGFKLTGLGDATVANDAIRYNGALGTPSSGTVTNLTGTASININGTVGATTPAAGSFTTATLAAGAVGTPSLTTTGDTNTGVWFPAADTVAVSTGGTERLRIDSSGNVIVTNATGGLGYGTGAGGTVTQATSKSTAVTLNKPTGQITMNNAALAGGTPIGFVFNNSLLTAVDALIVTIGNGGTAGSYNVWAERTGAGFSNVYLKNISGGSLSEAVVLNFSIIKGATS